MRLVFSLLAAALVFGFTNAAIAESHMRALVIGNDDYQNLPPATTSVSNAEEVSLALEQLGFGVTLIENGDAITFWQKVGAFSAAAATDGPDTLNFIYFAGRTAVESGQTYLLPIDAEAGSGISARAILIDQIISLSSAGGANVFVVLDLEQAVDTLETQLGVGPIVSPRKGLVAVVERAPEIELEEDAGEAFAITFSDESQLPNLMMDPFIELVAEGAQSYTNGQLIPVSYTHLTLPTTPYV